VFGCGDWVFREQTRTDVVGEVFGRTCPGKGKGCHFG